MKQIKYNISKYPLLCTAIGIVVLLWGLNLPVWFLIGNSDAGTFGDQFGAVNSLFSGLAFVGLIFTIIQQRESLEKQNKSIEQQREDLQNQKEELKLNRQELELAREEMKHQTLEFEKQNESLKIQRFENTFFNMMNLLQEIVNSLSLNYIEIPKNNIPTTPKDIIFFLPLCWDLQQQHVPAGKCLNECDIPK